MPHILFVNNSNSLGTNRELIFRLNPRRESRTSFAKSASCALRTLEPTAAKVRFPSRFQRIDATLAAANLRNVWTIATGSFKDARFATFPTVLCAPCIRAGTSERGVCPECGAPWVRTQKWAPSCQCSAGSPVPATMLDPFGGAGTVGLVADRLGRDSITIEISPDYADMAQRRIRADAPLLTNVVYD